MKKGFTLVELLGVIIVLALIMVLTFPSIINFIKKGNDDIDSMSNELIHNAAKLHVKENGQLYDNINGNVYCIPITELIEEGNLPEDIKLNEGIISTKSVKIIYNNKYIYEIVDTNSCVSKIAGCSLVDEDKDNFADRGEVITCTKDSISESFYVIDNKDGKINMLSKYNITKSIINPKQDTTDTTPTSKNSIVFSSNLYFYNTTNGVYTVDANYSLEGRQKPYVYNSSSIIYPYVETYRDVLEGMGVNVVDAKLLSYEQAISLGCSGTSCISSPSWMRLGNYWLGSGYSSDTVGIISGDLVSGRIGGVYYNSSGGGIRPVITIRVNELINNINI